MIPMKKKDKTPEELSEVEISNLPDKEFNLIIIKMLKDLRIKTDEHHQNIEVFYQRVEKYKKKQTEMKKNTLEGIISRSDDSEKLISELEDRLAKISEAEQEKEIK